MKNHVTDNFTEHLEKSVSKIRDGGIEKKIIALGNAYVLFFMEHPEYFTFLFSRGYIHVNLDFSKSDEINFKPFLILKDLCAQYFAEKKPELSDYEKELEIIRIWASVQGLTSIIFMNNVKWSRSWKKEISNLLR